MNSSGLPSAGTTRRHSAIGVCATSLPRTFKSHMIEFGLGEYYGVLPLVPQLLLQFRDLLFSGFSCELKRMRQQGGRRLRRTVLPQLIDGAGRQRAKFDRAGFQTSSEPLYLRDAVQAGVETDLALFR